MELPAAIDAATRLIDAGRDPLAAAAALRAGGVPPDLAAAALTQATLRQRAVAKFGADAGRLLFTRAGLEQATRSVVATRRAARLAAAGVRRIADLGCGLGADTIAFARAGMRVFAVEADPATAALARANLVALGLADRAKVVGGDATAVDLSEVDAVFCDPARRTRTAAGCSTRPRTRRPGPSWSRWPAGCPAPSSSSPPGSTTTLIPAGRRGGVGQRRRRPGRGHRLVWTVGRRPPPGHRAPRRGRRRTSSPAPARTRRSARSAVTCTTRTPAVVRSHLVGAFASTVDGALADPRIAYVFADTFTATPFAAAIEVVARLPYPVKQLRAALRDHDIGRLEIRKRGLDVDPDRLRRELRLAGRGSGTLVLTRIGETPVALLGLRRRRSLPAGRVRVTLPTVAGQGTPATALLARQRVTHQLHTYEVDADTPNYGAAVADVLGQEQGRVFKTLVTEVDGALTVAVVPVSGDVDLKALAGAAGGSGPPWPTAGWPSGPPATCAAASARSASASGCRRSSTPRPRTFETVFVSAGRRGLQVELAPADLIRLTGATHRPDLGMTRRAWLLVAAIVGRRAGRRRGLGLAVRADLHQSQRRRGRAGRPARRTTSRPSPPASTRRGGSPSCPTARALVTERDSAPASCRRRRTAPSPRCSGSPRRQPGGEGGLLGVAVSPDVRDRPAGCTSTTPRRSDNRIARLRLGAEPPQPIFTGIPKAGIHNGGRIAFGPDGMLYAGTGDAAERGRRAGPRHPGRQDPADHARTGGRRRATRSPARRSTRTGTATCRAWPGTRGGQLYAAEFGQNRYDELNRIEPGAQLRLARRSRAPATTRAFVNPVATWATVRRVAERHRHPGRPGLRGLPARPASCTGSASTARRAGRLLAGEYGRLRAVVVGPGRHAVGAHLQPRRPRRPRHRRRPDPPAAF